MNASARIANSAARKSRRLRRERSTSDDVASAVSAAMPAPRAAKAPKWWVHFVGVSASTANAITDEPMSRCDGPSAAPAILSRRSSTTMQTTIPRISSSTGNRRASEPSAAVPNSDW